MRFFLSAFLALSVAVGAGGEGAARPCPYGCCCGMEGPCECGHEDFGGIGDHGGQNDIPAAPPTLCNTNCLDHAAVNIAALGDSEVNAIQKSSGKAGAEKPNTPLAPFYSTRCDARGKPIIDCLNVHQAVLGLEETSIRLALLSTFRI